MPRKNSYQPLPGRNPDDDDDHNLDQLGQEHSQDQDQDQDQYQDQEHRRREPPTTTATENDPSLSVSVSVSDPNNDHDLTRVRYMSASEGAASTTTTTTSTTMLAPGAVSSFVVAPDDPTRPGLTTLRPKPLTTESAPVGATMTSSSSTTATTSTTTSTASNPLPSSTTPSTFLPRFGTKHKSLLGLKDRLSSSSSSSQQQSTDRPGGVPFSSSSQSGSSGVSSYARLVGSKSLASGLLGHENSSDKNRNPNKRGAAKDARSISDLAHIRPKQHPHTTLSGPRGIKRDQKRQVLREIRPDPHNLPEELLREQAKSGAAVEAALGGGLDVEGLEGGIQSASSDALLAGVPGSPGSPGGGGGGRHTSSNERGTLLGTGDGLGLGIGLGGKAIQQPSRWGPRPKLSTRQRRVPSSVVVGLGRENDQRVIQSSVFTPVLVSVDDGQPMTQAPALTPDHAEPMTNERFIAIVDSVKQAIRNGIQPLRIAQGSSGSYFCRNSDGKIVGVFKPKNEEPYGQLNPKWAKWIHRNLFPCCFGRSCLIPNLGYISESATSLVDHRLKLNIVPSTEVVWISSPAFHYDYLDRRAAQSAKGAKPLPDKVGSFQLFLNGFKDANLFMRDHPWPLEQTSADGTGKGRYSSWRRSSPGSVHSQQEDATSVYGSIAGSTNGGHTGGTPLQGYNPLDRQGFSWTPALQQQFKEQFEKMIILDYLIRNTDRGLDNWMIRYCEKDGISIVAPGSQRIDPQQQQQQQSTTRRSSRVGDLLGLYSDRNGSPSNNSLLREAATRNSSMLATPPGTPPRSNLSRAPSGMEILRDATQDTPQTDSQPRADSPTQQPPFMPVTPQQIMEAHYGPTHVHVAAIDNGLAFPFKHPDSWRSYPYGWLFLPRPLIAQPFTKATRDHFLPLLSSPVWWRETIADLRKLFSIDSDFDQGMFDKQMAVMKGQGWNIVETLKNLDHGPMDLCRRVAVVVWDEEVTLGPGVPSIPRPGSSLGNNSAFAGGVTGTTPPAYTNVQPTARTMDAKSSGYTNYGSMMTMPVTSATENRLSNPKTLSTSSTAIGEGTPFLASLDKNASQSLHKRPSYTVIDVDYPNSQHGQDRSSATEPPRHDSFRQVVSDGEYDLDDDDEYDDDDAFSYEEDYDYEDEEDDGLGSFDDIPKVATTTTSGTTASQDQINRGPISKDGMISIDMTLSSENNPQAPARTGRSQQRGRSESGQSGWGSNAEGQGRIRNHRRRQSHQSVGGSDQRRRSRQQSGLAPTSSATGKEGSTATLGDLSGGQRTAMTSTEQHTANHRRSRTEHDDRTGSVRFESSAAVGSLSPTGTRDGNESSPLILSRNANPFSSSEDDRAAAIAVVAMEVAKTHGSDAQAEPEPERGRSRGFFSAGYGAINGSNKDGEERISERPRWADRLRRGLSFDGHLLAVEGFGIGEASRRERKLRKQKQRERELRERRVILVERIEPVTKNLPYFKWW